jgi:hypothetical protein
MRNQLLLSHLASELPHSFVTQMIAQVPFVYADAKNAAKSDVTLGEPEADYVMPHLRRGKMEKFVREKASKCGLIALVNPTIKGKASYTLIKTKSIIFTISHLTDGGKLRGARFRQESSRLNKLLSQQRLFDDATNINETSIYAVLVHSEVGDSVKLEMAFPDENGSFIESFSFNEIIAAMSNDTANEIDNAHPILKQHKKQQGE